MGLLAAKEVTLIILELRFLFHPISILIPCGVPGTGKDVLKSLLILQTKQLGSRSVQHQADSW